MPNHTPTQPNGMIAEARKLIPTLILAVGVAFVTSWWNTQLTQNDMRFRIDRMEERQKELSATASSSAQTAQQNAIRLAELSIIQANLAEELKDLKQAQTRSR